MSGDSQPTNLYFPLYERRKRTRTKVLVARYGGEDLE